MKVDNCVELSPYETNKYINKIMKTREFLKNIATDESKVLMFKSYKSLLFTDDHKNYD